MKLTDFKTEFTAEEIAKIPQGDYDRVTERRIGNCDIVILSRDKDAVEGKANEDIDFYVYIRNGRSKKYKFVNTAFEEKGQFWFVTGTSGEQISLPSVSLNEPGLEHVKEILKHPRFSRETLAAKVKRGDDPVINFLYDKDNIRERQTREAFKNLGIEFIRFEQGLSSKVNKNVELQKKARALVESFVKEYFPVPKIFVPKTGIASLDGIINKTAQTENERISKIIQGLQGRFTKEVVEYLFHLVKEPSSDKSFSILNDETFIDGLIQKYNAEEAQVEWEIPKGSKEFSERMKQYAEELSHKDAKERESLKPIGYKHTNETYADMLIRQFFIDDEIYKGKSKEEKAEFKEELSDALLKMAGDMAFERSNKFIEKTIAFIKDHAGEEGISTEEEISALIQKHIDQAVDTTKTINNDQRDRVSQQLAERVKNEVVPIIEQKAEEAKREAELLKQSKPVVPTKGKKVAKVLGGIVLGVGVLTGLVVGATGHPAYFKDDARKLGEEDGKNATVTATVKEGTFDLEKLTVSGLKNVNEVVSKELNTKLGWARKSVGLEPVEDVYADKYAFGLANGLGEKAANVAIVADLVKKGGTQSLAINDYKDVQVVYPSKEGTETDSPEQMNAYLRETVGLDEDQIANFDATYQSSFRYTYSRAYNSDNYKIKDPSVGPQGGDDDDPDKDPEINFGDVFGESVEGNGQFQDGKIIGNNVYFLTDTNLYKYSLSEEVSTQKGLVSALASADAPVVSNVCSQDFITSWTNRDSTGKALVSESKMAEFQKKAAQKVGATGENHKVVVTERHTNTSLGENNGTTETLTYVGLDENDKILDVKESKEMTFYVEANQDINYNATAAAAFVNDNGGSLTRFTWDGTLYGYEKVPVPEVALMPSKSREK